MERYQLHASLSPNGKLLAIVGENPEGLKVCKLVSNGWSPHGITFSTGKQDKTCRVWDISNLSHSVTVLKGNLGAIRYTSMAMGEPADFVHVYDVSKGYETEQEIDFFGEISGISISTDTEALFVGVWDRP
ncbi:hypothetical protein HA466_0023960 [Hirschfeldia incana]|nr:hypothetical protein HA466_0023960 [Hirschfeldia incana]